MAQISAGVGLDSDERLRGVSLSDGRPVVDANIGYDHSSGVYLGASAAGQPGSRLVSYGQYLGYAARRGANLSWDVGVNNQSITAYGDQVATLHYTELYAGLNSGHLSAHAYYSPAYLRPGAQTLYLELAGTLPLRDQWRLFGHVGALTPLSGASGAFRRGEHYDAQAGVARAFNTFEVRLSWTGATPAQSRTSSRNPSGLVLGATYFF